MNPGEIDACSIDGVLTLNDGQLTAFTSPIYVIDFDKVQTVEDIKIILQALQPHWQGFVPNVEGLGKLLKELDL
jgi:hypothetical protein